jgi:hypothetical protein
MITESMTFRRNVSFPSLQSKSELSKKQAEAGGKLNFLGLFFDPEYGRDMLLRNVGLSPNAWSL